MKKDEMDIWLKSSLEEHSSPIPIGGWKGLHNSRKKKNKRQGLLWLLVAAVFLFGAITFWKVNTWNTPTQDQDLHTSLPKLPELAGGGLDEGRLPSAENVRKDPETKYEEAAIPALRPIVPQDGRTNEGLQDMLQVSVAEKQVPPALLVPTCRVPEISTGISKENPFLIKRSLNLNQRKRVNLSYFADIQYGFGSLSFLPDPEMADEPYANFIKGNRLSHHVFSAGLGVYKRLAAHWSLGSGIYISKSQSRGVLDYTQNQIYYFDPMAANTILSNETLIESNFRYAPDIQTLGITIPLRLRYQLFYGHGPFAEFGIIYRHTLSSMGNWIDPITLEPMPNQNNLAEKKSFDPEFSFGYQFRVRKTSLALCYRYIPSARLYRTPHGNLGADVHQFGLQLQMPH